MIPKAWLQEYAENRLRQVRERPLMWGGTWDGVDAIVMDMLELRDHVLAYPQSPAQDAPLRWSAACSKVYRIGNGSLFTALQYKGVTDRDAIHEKYKAALDEMFKSFEQDTAP